MKGRGRKEERRGVGHLSSGESTVWPGTESGPLADKTHVRALTHAHVTCMRTQVSHIQAVTHNCMHTEATFNFRGFYWQQR